MDSVPAPATHWSQCSKDQLQLSFDVELDYCLHNVPETVYDSTADCGNGIVDQGEQCDCGNVPASVSNDFYCYHHRQYHYVHLLEVVRCRAFNIVHIWKYQYFGILTKSTIPLQTPAFHVFVLSDV